MFEGARAKLPGEVIPFPVEPEYRIRPDLRKLEPGSRQFVLDEAWTHYAQAKLDSLSSSPQLCRILAGAPGELLDGLWQVAELIAGQLPGRVSVTSEGAEFPPLGVRIGRRGELEPLCRAGSCSESENDDGSRNFRARVVRHLETLNRAERLADALALSVQEDLVLIAGPPGADSARLLHVCFPSHWNPGERGNASFAQLHAPVPHNERLLAGSKNMIAAMLEKGPFVRYVWSLTTTPHLDQNPAVDRRGKGDASSEPEDDPIDTLYFRSERQTTTPLRSFALFTVRVYVAPLRQVLDEGRAERLAQAVRSMDEQLLAYKGLASVQERLLTSLDAYSRDSGRRLVEFDL